MANKANEASLAEANESLADGGIAVIVKYLGKLLTLLPFSLTKYSAIFAEVKGYFLEFLEYLDSTINWEGPTKSLVWPTWPMSSTSSMGPTRQM